MNYDGYVEEILTIPYLHWECDDTVTDICTNTSSFVFDRDGTMCRERIGQLSYYINDPASENSSGEPAPVLVTIRYRDSPHITYGDMQRLTHAIASRIVGQESVSSSSPGLDDDKESVGTLDDVSVDGDDDDAGSVGDDDNLNDDDREYDSDDNVY